MYRSASGRPCPLLEYSPYVRPPERSLSRTVRHPVEELGRTHASRVSRVVSRLAESGTSTRSLTPSKDSAAPYRPAVVHVGPLSVPLFADGEESTACVPVPASKDHAATSPVLGGGWL